MLKYSFLKVPKTLQEIVPEKKTYVVRHEKAEVLADEGICSRKLRCLGKMSQTSSI